MQGDDRIQYSSSRRGRAFRCVWRRRPETSTYDVMKEPDCDFGLDSR